MTVIAAIILLAIILFILNAIICATIFAAVITIDTIRALQRRRTHT